ncbi:hypothetical protein BC943DRAFT_329614 [Umbelopsis sp. AD052]|nr:hypothetical protein BC943DRAFT_329614 [Umbelopsis sp. AD052]
MLLEKEKSDLLAALPWSPLMAPSAQKFQIKRLFGQDYYLVLVTDLRNVWLEHAKSTDIYERALQSEIAIVKPDAESSPALIKILATFLDHVQEITESSDKLEIVCTRQVGFATVPWSFQCQQMASGGSTESWLDGPDTLYKHVTGPSLALGASYHLRYTQQRQKLMTMSQELSHLHENMMKAGLGSSNSKIGQILSDAQELVQLKETIQDEAAKANDIPQLLTTSVAELMIHATKSIKMHYDFGACAAPAYNDADEVPSGLPLEEDLIIAAGLSNNLRRRRLPSSTEEDLLSPKTNREKQREKRTALRESLAQQSKNNTNKRKRLL